MILALSEAIYSHRSLNQVSRTKRSPPEVFFGKGVLKITRKFTGEHLCKSAISSNFIGITLQHGCSPVN